MPSANQGPAQSIDMSQWRQEINTFAHETQAVLTEIIDELSNTFSPVESLSFQSSLRTQSHQQIVAARAVETPETDLEEMKNAKS